MNNRTVTVLEDGGRESDVAWKDLAVGDLVKVSQEGMAVRVGLYVHRGRATPLKLAMEECCLRGHVPGMH